MIDEDGNIRHCNMRDQNEPLKFSNIYVLTGRSYKRLQPKTLFMISRCKDHGFSHDSFAIVN